MSFLSVPVSLQTFFGGRRQIGSIEIDVVISESSKDDLTITKQPVQQGASITDHAFKEPNTLSMSISFRDNLTKSLSKIYQSLLDLQSSREPFDVVTPKRIYKSMLISALGVTTDKSSENILSVNISFQEVIIVKVSTTQVPRIAQRQPKVTAKTENAGKKSALLTLREGIGALSP